MVAFGNCFFCWAEYFDDGDCDDDVGVVFVMLMRSTGLGETLGDVELCLNGFIDVMEVGEVGGGIKVD